MAFRVPGTARHHGHGSFAACSGRVEWLESSSKGRMWFASGLFYFDPEKQCCLKNGVNFIELAGEINAAMPSYVVTRVAEALNDRPKPIKGSSILALGLAYKPNVDDERESPSHVLMETLHQRGAKVAYHDPYVPVIKPTREHAHWAGTESIPWNRETIAGFDLVLLATNHVSVNYQSWSSIPRNWLSC
jgi:UDP-N-acetyl-D-mannosaminuronate dehydrogenase